MTQAEIQKQAKIVGFTYLVTSLIGFANNFVIKPGLHKTETLLASEFQFRIGVMLDLSMYALVFKDFGKRSESREIMKLI